MHTRLHTQIRINDYLSLSKKVFARSSYKVRKHKTILRNQRQHPTPNHLHPLFWLQKNFKKKIERRGRCAPSIYVRGGWGAARLEGTASTRRR